MNLELFFSVDMNLELSYGYNTNSNLFFGKRVIIAYCRIICALIYNRSIFPDCHLLENINTNTHIIFKYELRNNLHIANSD